ncbi:hypothetical protein BDR03DRAFT_955941 [Suillus americanus]|nr:hypothetical protein BDR03DRAFT_955941 [Suillus americanus]
MAVLLLSGLIVSVRACVVIKLSGAFQGFVFIISLRGVADCFEAVVLGWNQEGVPVVCQ